MFKCGTTADLKVFFFLYSVGMGHPFETPVITHLAKKFGCIVMVEHHFFAHSCMRALLHSLHSAFYRANI